VKEKKVLLLRTNIAPEHLKKRLITMGAQVTETPVYETKKPYRLREQISKIVRTEKIDILTFTSSSTATHFFESLPRNLKLKAKIVSIGPVTSKTIKSFGKKIHKQAKEHTIPGLVQAILEWGRS
jgi:uroporphyrinogen III methyltransferase/synthase